LAGKGGLENAKRLVIAYKQGEIKEMTPELWKAKKIVDSTIHPGTYGCGEQIHALLHCALRPIDPVWEGFELD
jgi:hypothetical protein